MLLKRLSKAIIEQTTRNSALVLGGLCLSSSLMAAPAPINDSKAVFVGHSLINEQMPGMVEQLVNSGQGLTMEKAIQVMNGAPLRHNWEYCTEASFTGEWPPSAFACDAINAGTATGGTYDTLVVTEANNPIRGQHFYNETQKYLENFADLLVSKNPNGRTFLYTSWEGIYYHEGEWTDEIAGELAEYEQIVAEAKRISIDKGVNASIEIIPSSLALKELIIKVENGEIPGLTNREDLFHDSVHLEPIGNYFMANVVFSAIYNQSPEGLSGTMMDQWGGQALALDAAVAAQLQQLAWQVVSDYRAAQELPEAQNGAPNSRIVTPDGTQYVELGREITFEGTATDPDNDTALTYNWDFGSIAPAQNTATTTPVTFNQAGTHKVYFTATDSQGKSDPSPAVGTIVVLDPLNHNDAPNGEITTPSTTQTISVGESVSFTSQSTDAQNDTNLTYRWYFGDGAPMQFTADTTPVVFNHAGQFDVTFTVTDSMGFADLSPSVVRVNVVDGPVGPEAIADFSATNVTEQGSSTLTWTAPSTDVHSYTILVNNSVYGTMTGNASSIEVTGLDTSIVNSVRVIGANVTGETVAETPVYNIAALGGDNGDGSIGAITLSTEARLDSWGVALSWTPVAGSVQFYQIHRDGVFAGFTYPDTLSYNDDWLSLHTDYSYQIKAVDFGGEVIGESDIVVSKAGDSVNPSKVENFKVTFNGDYGFDLSWDAATDNAEVQMYVLHRNGQPFTTTSATTFDDDWPPAGAVTYQVFARDTAGNLGEGSAVVTAAVPSQDFALSGASRNDSWGVALTWNNMGSDVQFYQIYRDGVFVGFTDTNTTSYNDDWLTLQTDYTWQIRAVNAAEELLEVSNEITMQAGDSVAPTQPANLAVEFNGSYGFNVTWDASTDNTGVAYYKVYRNGEAYTTAYTNSLADDWPPQGDVTYQIIAVDAYHNLSQASEVVTGNVNQ